MWKQTQLRGMDDMTTVVEDVLGSVTVERERVNV